MNHLLAVLLIVPCLLSSCIVPRRTINPPIPSVPHAATKGAITISVIQDVRVFENKPSDPSAPSVYRGDPTRLSIAQKAAIIGRDRNAFGQGLGVVALPAGQSMNTKMHGLLAEAFARRGYTPILDSGNRAQADVQRFWGWVTPGMWSFGFEAAIRAQITVSLNGRSRTFTVSGHGATGGQVVKEANWNEAWEAAFEDFLKNLDRQLQQAGF